MTTHLGKRLIEALRHAPMSQAELAQALGVGKGGRGWINRITKGRVTPNSENVREMAKILGVSAPWLANGSPTARPKWLDEVGAMALADGPVSPRPSAPAGDSELMETVGRLTVDNQRLRAQLAQLDRDDESRAAKLRQLQAERDALAAQRQALEVQLRELSQRLTALEARQPSSRSPARVRGGKR